MQTVLSPNTVEREGTETHEETMPSYCATTLYELLAVMQDVVGPDDALVVATVGHLLRSGRLTWRGQTQARPGSLQRAALEAMPRVSPWTTAETSSFTGQHEECTP